jgi:hypothetical protein
VARLAVDPEIAKDVNDAPRPGVGDVLKDESLTHEAVNDRVDRSKVSRFAGAKAHGPAIDVAPDRSLEEQRPAKSRDLTAMQHSSNYPVVSYDVRVLAR